MIDYKEYSRQRDIAVKRLKRMGVKAHVPTVKELRQSPETAEGAFSNLTTFLSEGPSLSKKRESGRKHYTLEEMRERKREYNREYRKRKKAREFAESRGYSSSRGLYGVVKGARTLGLNLHPSEVKGFLAYMEYRFAQGVGSLKYAFARFEEDYEELRSKGYNPNKIIADFEQFSANQAELTSRADGMVGIDSDTAHALWTRFVNK